jgi:hypothetical protein
VFGGCDQRRLEIPSGREFRSNHCESCQAIGSLASNLAMELPNRSTGTSSRTASTTEHCPGQGEFDITGFLRAIFSTGFTGPIGAEIFSIENRARSLQQAVADNYDAMAKSVQTALA